MPEKNSWNNAISPSGAFVRKAPSFREQITADGSSGFKAEKDRYHLYVSLACPWVSAQRYFKVTELSDLLGKQNTYSSHSQRFTRRNFSYRRRSFSWGGW